MKKLLPFNWPKHGTPLCSVDDQTARDTLFRLIQAGRRWVAALGAEKAWLRGMVISPDFTNVHASDDLAHIPGSYPSASFLGYIRDEAKDYVGYLVGVDQQGTKGRWVVPPDAIPDFNEPATVGGALFLLRHLGSPQEVAVVSMAIATGRTADMAEAFADAAERIAANGGPYEGR